MIAEPGLHPADRKPSLVVHRGVRVRRRDPRFCLALELGRRDSEAPLRSVDPSAPELERRLARGPAQEQSVVVRPGDVGTADRVFDAALELLGLGELWSWAGPAPTQRARPTTLEEPSSSGALDLVALQPQVTRTHRRYGDDRNRRHARRWYLDRWPPPPDRRKKPAIERGEREIRRRRKHAGWSALTQRMERCGRAALLACSLALGCGRTPIDVLDGGIRSEDEVYDPLVDGCDKVDFLFVVDNSSSMADNQHKLALGVLDFLDGVDDVTGAVDSVHIGVVTTDGYDHNAPGCDEVGALVSQTGGHNSSQRQCGPFAEGHRFMTEADDLEDALECTVKVGTTGSTSERPLTAIRSAVDPTLDAVEACNEGFLRSDALLVVIIVTDEDAAPSEAYDTLVEAKGGNDEAIVVLTIAHTEADTCRRSGHAQQADVLSSFTSRFPFGLTESICATSFEAPFRRATQVIQSACGG